MIFSSRHFFQKTNERILFYQYATCFRSFFGRILGQKKMFRDYLTFSKATEKTSIPNFLESRFALDQHYIELKTKKWFNDQQWFAFQPYPQLSQLKSKFKCWQLLTGSSQSVLKSYYSILGIYNESNTIFQILHN